MVALTPERRAELKVLLDDEQRLRAEYPKVSEYLDMAPTLAGTGDAHADAAFDLRFVHYVTGGTAVSPNPYWDIVAPCVSEYGGRPVVNGGLPDGSPRLAYAQTLLHSIFAYAIPSPETLEWMVAFCAGRRVVEIGAGRGYWAAQMARSGITVDAYDVAPPGQVENVSFPREGKHVDLWHPVAPLEEFRFDGNGRADHVLLLCWPSDWGDATASGVLSAFEAAGGDRVIFVGQPRGGITGDDAFFDLLAADWELADEDPLFVSWWNLGDVAQCWVRR